jgi:F-type H+-transporting ATPase subunit b
MRIRRFLGAAVLAAGALAVLAGPAAAQESGDNVHAAVEQIDAGIDNGSIDKVAGECAVHALENDDADRCQEAPNLILPATNELIWGAISFLVLLAALWKFGLPAVTKMSNERTARIKAAIDEAELAKSESQTVLADYQRQLADARNEAGRIVEEARQQAEQVRRDLTARAEADAAELRARNAEQIAAEAGRVQGELQQQVAGLAIDLAERVVGASLDREANLRLIEDYINTVGAN